MEKNAGKNLKTGLEIQLSDRAPTWHAQGPGLNLQNFSPVVELGEISIFSQGNLETICQLSCVSLLSLPASPQSSPPPNPPQTLSIASPFS